MAENDVPKPFLFLNMITSTWTTQLLAAAAELGIADTLSRGPLGAGEVAERIGADAAITYRIMRAMATLGVLEQLEERRFVLTELGQFLRSDVPGSMRALAIMLGQPWHNRCWETLTDCAKSGVAFGAERAFGGDLWAYFDKNRGYFENFNEAMTGASETMHVTAVEAYDFSGIQTLVDVGGGHGRLLGMILKRNPEMRGILFDRPPLADGAQGELQKLGIANRCRFEGGDFRKTVPAGGDAYIMSHILHDWPDKDALAILKNCRAGIKPGGKVIVLDAVIKPGNEKDFGKLMDIEMMMMFGGRDRTELELSEMFQKAGFALTRVIPTASSISVVEGVAK